MPMLLEWTFAKIAVREALRDVLGLRQPIGPLSDHLQAALQWLALAQDQTGNGGVSAATGQGSHSGAGVPAVPQWRQRSVTSFARCCDKTIGVRLES